MLLAAAEDELHILQRLNVGTKQRFHIDVIIPDLLKLINGNDGLLVLFLNEIEDCGEGLLFVAIREIGHGEFGITCQRVVTQHRAKATEELEKRLDRLFLFQRSNDRLGKHFDKIFQSFGGINIHQTSVDINLLMCNFIKNTVNQPCFSITTGRNKGYIRAI